MVIVLFNDGSCQIKKSFNKVEEYSWTGDNIWYFIAKTFSWALYSNAKNPYKQPAQQQSPQIP